MEQQLKESINEDDDDVSPASRPPKLMIDSVIMESHQYEYLKSIIDDILDGKQLILKYRATVDGDNNFHSNCDNIPNTIMLIKVKETGQVFGGYTKNAWDTNGGYKKKMKVHFFSLFRNQRN